MAEDKMSIDDCCIGHIGAIEDACYNCIPDDKNAQCPSYFALKDRLPQGQLYNAYAVMIREKMRKR